MRLLFSFFTIVILSIEPAMSRSQVKAVGSSTVFPFITAAAEEFSYISDYRAPIVEATGTGGGFKIFCQGIGIGYADIANASRPIKDSEVKLCAENGVKNLAEIKIGYDGIIIANKIGNKKFNLTKKELFLALAKNVPIDGKLVKNPYQKWSDINAKLPDQKIYIYGPPPTSGTRDAFVELVMHDICDKFSEFKTQYPDKKKRHKICSIFREDDKYAEAGENDNIVINKLNSNQNALGIFGFSFLEENLDKVQAAKIDNYAASFENISAGIYPISRSLFVYVKTDHYNLITSLKPFVRELISTNAIGEFGYLTEKGLIPLQAKELAALQNKLNKSLQK